LSEERQIFFSVVIPTYERPYDLRICLNSLRKEIQQGSHTYEIIVTDDSKSDESRKMVEKEFPDVSWGKGKQNGPAGNRNAGVERAKGKWIVFLDDDCIAQEGYLNAYAKAIKANRGMQVFEGRIFVDRPRKTWAEGCPENENGGMLWTSNLCVNRKLFLEMGGLDERFKIAFEDVDFAHRLRLRRINSKFVFDASVCHPWRGLRAGGNNWKRKGYELESLLLFLNKHPEACGKYGSVNNYLRNFCRMMTKDLSYCLFKLYGKGIDVLFLQALNTLRTAIYVLRLSFSLKSKT
jgi:GT2 family glycosyltransferase